jgi:hypothetical protein
MEMTMTFEKEKFEDYLREFEPRRPRALPFVGKFAKVRRAAAGATALAACAAAVWLVARRPTTVLQGDAVTETQAISARELTRLALEDPAEFERALAAASREMLPGFEGVDSGLKSLAK